MVILGSWRGQINPELYGEQFFDESDDPLTEIYTTLSANTRIQLTPWS
jgi:hypothetical protein